MLVRLVDEAVHATVRRLCNNDQARLPAWQAVYIYHDYYDERLLCLDLVPLMLEELLAGRVEAFFFIRYAVGGKHLRLRFRAYDPALLDRVRRFESLPESTFQPASYEPEVARYGGTACIGICEAHFMLSSFCVWNHLRPHIASPPSDVQRRVRLPQAALDMMTVVRRAYHDIGIATCFLKAFWQAWLLPVGVQHDQRCELLPRLEGQMRHQFDLIDTRLKTLLYNAWSSVDQNDAASMGWSTGTHDVLEGLREAGLDLSSRAGMRAVSGLIHMHNNRLGLANRDEAFLAYACERTLVEACT